MKRFPFRNFHLPVVLAAVLSLGSAPSALAEHEWTKVDSSTIENDLWTLAASWNNGQLTLNGATPKDGSLTTLDVSEMTIDGKALHTIQAWQNKNITTIKKLVVPYELNGFTTEVGAIPDLEEICTPDGGHELSIKSWGKSIVNKSDLTGDYVVSNITDFGAASGGSGAFYECPNLTGVTFLGSYSVIREKVVFLSAGIKSIDFETTASISEIPNCVSGFWGDKSPSEVTVPVQLTSLTLNGTPMLRCADITKVGSSVMPHAQLYTGIVDLPNCASVGEYSFRDTGIPFVNLMSVTSLGKYCFYECKGLSRVVFGAESFASMIGTDILSGNAFNQASDASVIWNCKTLPTFNGPCFRDLGKETKRITNYVRKEANWFVENMASRPYVKNDGEEWCLYDWNNKSVRQPLVAMDTVFKVNLRLGGEVVSTTLMPGVAGEDSVWTISADWFLPPGATYGTGSVKDVDGTVIPGASATPMDSGKKLSITLPQSLVLTDASTTLESEVFVDLAAIQNEDSHVTVTILDGQERTVVTNEFDVPYGGSAVKDYAAEIFGDSEYTYNQVMSLVVEPEGALGASMDFSGKLTVSNAMESAAVTVKINRTKIPKQMDHWEVSSDGYSMTDGIWTFRCDFNGTNAVVANAESFLGSDLASVVVDFSLPIFQNGISVEATRFDWGAEVNGSAIDLTKNNCGKSLVINGSAATPNTLIAGLVLPSNPIELFAGWGGCTKLALDVEDLIMVTTNIGAYALCETRASGDLTFPDGKVVTIGPHAFDKCLGITSVTIRGFGSTIGDYAFRENSKLTSADIGGVVSLGQYAFSKDKLTTLVICPLLQSFPAHVFDYPSDNLTMSVAEVTTEMLSMKAIDGSFGTEAFRDYRGKGALIFPFRGTITSTGTGSFKWLGPCTNIVFWGKAPAEEAFSTSAVTEQNASQSYTRRITVSKAMDEAGWTAWATPCTDEEKARDDYPGDSVCFGTHSFGDAKLWMCWGRSPWEISPGLLILLH